MYIFIERSNFSFELCGLVVRLCQILGYNCIILRDYIKVFQKLKFVYLYILYC